MTDLFAPPADSNGKPIPAWQARLEQLYDVRAPFDEILGLVRALIDDTRSGAAHLGDTPRAVRLARLRAFAETGAIGVYDADDLHDDVRWLLSECQRLQGERDAFLADYTAELEGGMEMRKLFGARQGETLWGCVERVAAELDAVAKLVRERDALQDEVLRLRSDLARIKFILGGHSGTSEDNDEAALRENAQRALERLRALGITDREMLYRPQDKR